MQIVTALTAPTLSGMHLAASKTAVQSWINQLLNPFAHARTG